MRLKNFILSALLVLTPAFVNVSCMQAQEDDFFFTEFVRDEATYQSQELVIPRSSTKNPVTLRDQLSYVVGKLNYTGVKVIQSYTGGMEVYEYDDVSKVLDIDPVYLSYDKGETQLKRKQFEINTSIYLNYLDKNQAERCLIMHLRPRGFLNTSVYTRTTIILPSDSQQDDLRSYNSKSAPIALSYLTAFDVADRSKDLEKFKKIYDSTLKKYNSDKDLDEIEEECLKGLREQEDFWQSVNYGNWLYQNARYYDASIHYQPAYDILKSYIRPDQSDFDETFYTISYNLGMSLWKLGYYDSAEYYLGVASYGDKKYNSDYYALLETKSNLKTEGSGKDTKLGQILSVLFDIDKFCVKEALYNVDGKLVKLSDKSAIWDFDVKSLCSEQFNYVTLGYTRARYEMEGSNSEDKSKLCYENNIIISSYKVGNNKWRITFVIPNFRNFDYKKTDDDFSRPVSASFIIGSDNAGSFAPMSVKPSFAEIKKQYDFVLELKADNRFMEALLAVMPLEDKISKLSDKERSKDNVKELHGAILYQIGFLLSELQQPIKAVSYLSKASSLSYTTDIMQEYVAILSNIVDPRAFRVIKEELLSNPKDQVYKNLLNRRYAYMLIEYGKLDDAEKVLKGLLDDPASASFAKTELEYIKQLKRQ